MTAIEAEHHFVEVGRRMLCGDVVPGSHESGLGKGEAEFDGIGVNQPGDILLFVADRLVSIRSGAGGNFFRVSNCEMYDCVTSAAAARSLCSAPICFSRCLITKETSTDASARLHRLDLTDYNNLSLYLTGQVN